MRSFRGCFESKEEIACSRTADFPDLIAEAVGRRASDEPQLDMVANAPVIRQGMRSSRGP
jgi:hypothetical protein